jgi:hypothetical protein
MHPSIRIELARLKQAELVATATARSMPTTKEN